MTEQERGPSTMTGDTRWKIEADSQTHLLIVIADCLVTLAEKAAPDAGQRRSLLDQIKTALLAVKGIEHD